MGGARGRSEWSPQASWSPSWPEAGCGVARSGHPDSKHTNLKFSSKVARCEKKNYAKLVA